MYSGSLIQRRLTGIEMEELKISKKPNIVQTHCTKRRANPKSLF